MGSLPELSTVTSSRAAASSGVCQGPPSPLYPPASLVLPERGPVGSEGWSSLWSPSPEGDVVWCSPLALTPTGGERVIE